MGKAINLDIKKPNKIDVDIERNNLITLDIRSQSGTTNYNALTNKPQINGVTLVGNKLDYELYLQHEMDEITAQDIDRIIYGG